MFQSQLGANNNIEYSWSSEISELIIQYYFQLVRNSNLSDIERRLNYLLYNFKITNNLHNNNFNLLRKMIVETRDIKYGKGEYYLSYLQLYIWWIYYPNIAKQALLSFVYLHGSWKDIKNLCHYIFIRTMNMEHPFITYAISIMISQLKLDILNLNNGKYISLAAKWAPRQKSKHNRLFNKMSKVYFQEYFSKIKNRSQYKRALRKAKTHFRKLLSKLNKKLETPQIYMCDKQWSNINFNKLTSGTLKKYKYAFLNTTKREIIRYNNADRLLTRDIFMKYIKTTSQLPSTLYEYELVKEAISIPEICKTNSCNEYKKLIINSQWLNLTAQHATFKYIIPMIDISAYMLDNNNIPLLSAIGIGLRISENSNIFKNRLLLFGEYPIWLNLSKYSSFVDKVLYIMKSISSCKGASCRLYRAIEFLFDNLLRHTNTFPKNLYIFILSHMQFEKRINKNSLYPSYDSIQNRYAKSWRSMQFPHIVFWNLYSTNGFPVISKQKYVTMVSGYNGTILKNLLHKKNNNYMNTPYKTISTILDFKRFCTV